MKLLIIDEEFPFPLNSGKRIRTYNLTRVLAAQNEITYLAYGNSDSEAYHSMKAINVSPECVQPINRKQSGLSFYWRLLTNLTSPYPYIVTSHYSDSFQKQLDECLKQTEYDLIICEWTPYAIFVKDILHIKRLIVAHNIETAIWQRYEQNERNPFRRMYISIQRAKVERFERQAFSWVNGATAVCQSEAESISSLGVSYPVEVIDNGVDLAYFKPANSKPKLHHLVFTGSMDWRPNQDAMIYFVHDILPLIRKQIPEVTFSIVGRKPPQKIIDLGSQKGVTVTGTVDDVRDYISEAAVYVVPLRIGGGSRLKILEAMAMEKPVISTSIGAEGLQVTDKKNIAIFDKPGDFADGVVALLQDAAYQQTLGKAGRELVEQNYGWDQLGKRLHAYLCQIAGKS
jgi:sugar transferase (PEP-CTERM/EpsH1 system associated)